MARSGASFSIKNRIPMARDGSSQDGKLQQSEGVPDVRNKAPTLLSKVNYTGESISQSHRSGQRKENNLKLINDVVSNDNYFNDMSSNNSSMAISMGLSAI